MASPKQDRYSQYKENIIYSRQKYLSIKQKYNLEAGQESSLEHQAQPFEKGYFTLAVMGKTSSGKSTFLNALLGISDLLPTGANQTTSGITYIRHAEQPRIEITFGDGKKKELSEDLQKNLQQVVSVGDFSNLPFTLIDDCILQGMSAKEILEQQQALSEKSGMHIDRADLQSYLNKRRRGDIPIEVIVYTPLPEQFRTWQILDTPGVGAIGGIENKTFELLNEKTGEKTFAVDAIIFCIKGTDAAEERSNIDFIQETIDRLYPVTRKRLFMVATHYKEMKEEERWKASIIHNLPKDISKRLYLLDSYIEQLRADLAGTAIDIQAQFVDQRDRLPAWSDEQYKAYRSILREIEDALDEKNEAKNNETYLRFLEGLSAFSKFRNDLDKFVVDVRGASYETYVMTLKGDIEAQRELKKKSYEDTIRGLNRELNELEGRTIKDAAGQLAKSEDEEKAAREVRRKFSEDLLRIRDQEYSRAKIRGLFDEIAQALNGMTAPQKCGREHCDKIETELRNIWSSLEERRIEVLDQLQQNLTQTLRNYQIKQGITLPQVDFGSLRSQATKKYTTKWETTHRHFWTSIFTLGLMGKYTKVHEKTDYDRVAAEILHVGRIKLETLLGETTSALENIIKDWTRTISEELAMAKMIEDEAVAKRQAWITELAKHKDAKEKLQQAKAKIEQESQSFLRDIDIFISEVKQLKK
jgi:hypothetical protein